MEDEEKGFTIRDRRSHMEGHTNLSKDRKEEKNTASQKDPFQSKKGIEINFSTFLFSLGSSVMIALGEEANPFTGEKSINLTQAQESIDLLTILQEKTKGNLTQEEESLLSNLLFSARMKFVELARKQGPL